MDYFKLTYSLLGGLGLFFYGMKGMSNALQSAAGDLIKNIIGSLTSNRFFAVTVGVLVTMLVQSSSVTTVMVIGFVNAGLMDLVQAIGVIFGANIGTTVTGWIISIKVGKYGLLFIGIGIFPFLFAKNQRAKQIGQLLFSIGLIFYGLMIMSNAFKPLRTDQDFLNAISMFSDQNYLSYLASIALGCLLTIVIQSSSAMLGITIALASTGVINMHTAIALVMGENIGTTITALLASVGGNVHAKRAARAHALFNLLGVLVLFSILPVYIQFIEWLVPGEGNFLNAANERPNVAVHIATSHTVFNVTCTILFIPFIRKIAALVTKLTPDTEAHEKKELIMLGNPNDMVPTTALVQAWGELEKMADITERMFITTRGYIEKKIPKEDFKIHAKIKDYESIADNIQKEITVFIGLLMESPLSANESKEAQSLVRLADELESITDYLELLSNYKKKIYSENLLVDEAREEFFIFFDEVHVFYQDLIVNLKAKKVVDIDFYSRKTEFLRSKADDLRDKQVKRATKGNFSILGAMTYSDMLVAMRKIRSHTYNAIQSVHRIHEGDAS